MSERGKEWQGFSEQVVKHIEEYTVPQYGDTGNDLCTDYTPEHCIKQIEKYVKRFGRNTRPGQQNLDLLKMAHYAQMAHTKLNANNVAHSKEINHGKVP